MKIISPGKVYVPLYKRWWFWGLVACGAVATWQAVLYFNWQGDMTKYQIRNAVADAYMQREQDKAAALEAAYKADTYGGATPEETLKLFIDALEKKDYELASKYFVAEEQGKQKNVLEEGSRGDALTVLLDSYHRGIVNISRFQNGHTAEIKLIPPGETVGFIIEMELNTFTNQWKIKSL